MFPVPVIPLCIQIAVKRFLFLAASGLIIRPGVHPGYKFLKDCRGNRNRRAVIGYPEGLRKVHLLVPGDLIGRKGKGQKRPHAQGNRQEANLRPRTDPSAPPKKQKSKACRTPEKDKAVRVEPGARLCPKACKAHRIGVKIHGQQPRLPQAFPGHGNRRISGAPTGIQEAPITRLLRSSLRTASRSRSSPYSLYTPIFTSVFIRPSYS